MNDIGFIPIRDEQAKLGERVGAARATAGYVADILGDLPKDLAGLLVGDRAKAMRQKRLDAAWRRAKLYLHEQGVEEPQSPGVKLALPILAGAADETREELQDLWARLLAAAMNPTRSALVRLRFAEALQRLDPLDAQIMMWMREHSGRIVSSGTMENAASDLRVTLDEIRVSLQNLEKAEFTTRLSSSTIALTAFGREFIRVVIGN
jgi:hypothetical protein